MNRRQFRWAVLAFAGLGLLIGLAQPVPSRADQLSSPPTPTTSGKVGGPGSGG